MACADRDAEAAAATAALVRDESPSGGQPLLAASPVAASSAPRCWPSVQVLVGVRVGDRWRRRWAASTAWC